MVQTIETIMKKKLLVGTYGYIWQRGRNPIGVIIATNHKQWNKALQNELQRKIDEQKIDEQQRSLIVIAHRRWETADFIRQNVLASEQKLDELWAGLASGKPFSVVVY